MRARNRVESFHRTCIALGAATLGLIALTGCHVDMWVQPKDKTLQESDFFADRQGSRPLVPHTLPRGFLRLDAPLYTGVSGNKLVDTFPFPITKADLLRGQERFNIYCSPCHSRLGDGNGMIAQRGFSLRRPPASYHTDRLRRMPVGHFFDVITHGYGAMYSYADRVEPDDRWRIAAYIRTLQLSEHATVADVPPADMAKLENAGNAPTPTGSEPEQR